MITGRMWKSIKLIFMQLLVISVLATGAAGCASQVPSERLDPFITDRVVEVRIVMEEEDWTSCQVNAMAEEYVQADFWFDGELVPDVAVRPKGNSSLLFVAASGSPRFSLKVDFNLFNRARNFRGLKKVNLNNGWSDPTLLRERLAYELFEQMGIPTPRSSFVDVWVNDSHLGVYTMVEQIDKTFLGRHFPKDDGHLYKPEMPVSFLDWTEADLEEHRAGMETTEQDDLDSSLDVNLGGGKLREIMQALEQQDETDDENATPEPLNLGMLLPGITPGQPIDYLEQMMLKTNENRPDHSALFRFLDILNNEPDETFPAEIEEVLDVDEFLRFLAVSTVIIHLDNYPGTGHNYYLYEVDGYFTIIPWDLNMAFGSFDCFGLDREGIINLYIDEPTCGPMADRPLIERLLSHQPYLDAYHRYLQSLLDGPFSVAAMESLIDGLADLIRPFIEPDELMGLSTTDFEQGLSEDVKRTEPGGGEPVGDAPPDIPDFSLETWSCILEQFSTAELRELATRGPNAEDLAKIMCCMSPEDILALQPQTAEDVPAGVGLGLAAVSIGLKDFVAERSASIKQQLEGKRPSAGDGSGNGGNIQMLGW